MAAKIFIANLPKDANESEIREMFSKYGEVREVRLLTDKRTPYGFVEFNDPSVVDEVIKEEKHREYKGQIIRVERATGKSTTDSRDRRGRDEHHRRKTDYRLEVTHLPYRCSWQQLKDHMKREGEVNYCSVNGSTGYVEYVHYEDMKSALKHLDDTKLICGGESSYIHLYRYDDRSSSRGRSRSRSYRRDYPSRRRDSRSRSRSGRRYDRSNDRPRDSDRDRPRDSDRDRPRDSDRDRPRDSDRDRPRDSDRDRPRDSERDRRSSSRTEANQERNDARSPSRRDSRSPPRDDSRSPARRSPSRDSRSPPRSSD